MEPRGENQSFRKVFVRELPLVPNMSKARQLSPSISPQEALYYGLIPSLIHEIGAGRNPIDKAIELANKCLDTINHPNQDSVMTDVNVKALLHSFVTGNDKFRMPDLLPLMSVGEKEGSPSSLSPSSSSSSSSSSPSKNTKTLALTRWIPLHMVEVLRLFSSSRFYDSPKIQHILCSIVQNFEGFLNGKNEGGDRWESLFTIPLLIRSLVNDFDSVHFLFQLNLFPVIPSRTIVGRGCSRPDRVLES
mmetsp:Transcript_12813/g.19676  ORF Transcript_12813/g.19676 Transcript_12813/m.19676 type:complete len:247 (+) Transcript_12813:1172-1912(+)